MKIRDDTELKLIRRAAVCFPTDVADGRSIPAVIVAAILSRMDDAEAALFAVALMEACGC